MSFFADLRPYGYYSRQDHFERRWLRWRERFGLYPPHFYMKDVMDYSGLSIAECLERAKNKALHKELWDMRERKTESEYQEFYQESDFYIYRQPWRYRHYTWHFLATMLPLRGSMVDYGCGAAVMTEWMSRRYPAHQYVATDIQSASLDFVKFRFQGRTNVEVKTIGLGKSGLPLTDEYNLIICCEVMEHTYNPDEICQHFIEYLAPEGLLYLNYQNSGWEGENLIESRQKRDLALAILQEGLKPLKAVDESGSDWGLYQK